MLETPVHAHTAPLRVPQERVHPVNHRFFDLAPSKGRSKEEILAGLLAPRKCMDPKFLYDATGSKLFELICLQPEYYIARREKEVLQTHGREMAALLGEDCTLIEPGCGNAEKVEYILAAGSVRRYVGVDIDTSMLRAATRDLARRHPALEVWGVCANYSELERILGISEISLAPNVIFFPGSTLGNASPQAARAFLQRARLLLGPSGRLLLGLDRRKKPELLCAAYNDAAGVTAAFNKNILLHVNALADADFEPADFEHLAFYDDRHHRVEMHLVCRRDLEVWVCGRNIPFRKGETIHTEDSHKYDPDDVSLLVTGTGWEAVRTWSDRDRWFSIYLLKAYPA